MDWSLLDSPDEIAVTQILLDLPDIIRERSLNLKWATKKKRSVPKPMKTHKKPAAAVDSPLSFPAIESGNKRSNNNSTNKARDKYFNSIKDLTRVRDCLREEIEKVSKHYTQLSAYNSELKAMKQKVLSSQVKSALQPQPQPPVVEAVKFQFTAQFYSPSYRLDPSRAFTDRQAAEARRLRKEIIKTKSIRTRKA